MYTNCTLQSRLQHVYLRQLHVRVDLNRMPESALSPSQGFGFGLSIKVMASYWRLCKGTFQLSFDVMKVVLFTRIT